MHPLTEYFQRWCGGGAAGEHRLARDTCYAHVRRLALHASAQDVPRMDAATRLSCHVQACLGCAAADAALLLADDRNVRHPDTLTGVVAALRQLQDAVTLALPCEPLYWLVLNGTVHIYRLCKVLAVGGFCEQALPPLVFCVRSIEAHVVFSSARHLPWRIQLYTLAAWAYCDLRAYDAARALLADGSARLDALLGLLQLDPVPPLPEVAAGFKAAKAGMAAVRLRVEVAADAGGAAMAQLVQDAGAVGGAAGLTALLEALQVRTRVGGVIA